MWHCITCFLGEKLVYLSWPNSGRQSTNKSSPNCCNVCARYENKLLGRGIVAPRYKDYYNAKAVENPNQVGDRRSALNHMSVAGPMWHYRKDFWCGLPSSEGGWVTAGAGGLQQSEMLPRTKEDQPPANAICYPEMKNRNLIRHQETSRKTDNEKEECSLVVTRGQQGTTKDHLLSSNHNEWTSLQEMSLTLTPTHSCDTRPIKEIFGELGCLRRRKTFKRIYRSVEQTIS